MRTKKYRKTVLEDVLMDIEESNNDCLFDPSNGPTQAERDFIEAIFSSVLYVLGQDLENGFCIEVLKACKRESENG